MEADIHNTLLTYDGLVESAATNQGAWLTESAGALSDLHAAVLRSLGEFSIRKGSSPSSSIGFNKFAEARGGGESTSKAAVPVGVENSSGAKAVSIGDGDTTKSVDPYRLIYRQEGGDKACAEDHGVSSADGDGDVTYKDATTLGTGDGMRNAANSQDSSGTATTKTTTGATGRTRTHLDEQRDHRRARLRHLGLILARKRQFAASRQVCA